MKNEMQKENPVINQTTHSSEKKLLNKAPAATLNGGNYNIHQYNVVFTPYDIKKSFKISQQKAYDKLQSAKMFLQTNGSSYSKVGVSVQPSMAPKRQTVVVNGNKQIMPTN